MRARFVSCFFFSKTLFSIFTSQKTSGILREYVCRPLSNRGRRENNNSDIYRNNQHMFLLNDFETFNTVSLIINHINRIGRVQKFGKCKRQKYVVTNRPLNTTLYYSNSRDKYDKN